MSRPVITSERQPVSTGPATLAEFTAPSMPSGAVTAGSLLVLGGLAGLAQLVLPWASTAAGSTSGWGQYYNTAHHGFGEIVAAYAILLAAIAGLVMLVSGIRLLMPHAGHRGALLAATVAGLVAFACAAWTLAVGAGPSAAQETFGWYLFLLAGLVGLLGVGLARSVLTMPIALMLFGGAAALAQLALPWFSSGNRATTGWQQYYDVAHPNTAEMIGAYAILVAAICGLVLLATAITLAAGRRDLPSLPMANLVLAASVLLLVCAGWWLAAGSTPQGATLSFGWYAFLIAGAGGLLGALGQGAAGCRLDSSSAVLILAGLAGLAAIALPWFSGATGWGFYYRTTHRDFTEIGAAYAILIGTLASVVLLLAGMIMAVQPALRRTLARIARVAAIVVLVCIAWWLVLGPETFADAIASGGFGWYLFVLAGVLGLIGALVPLVTVSFDKVSFMTVFLGVPVLIFLVFVVSPFVQAVYYSMTDWGGFSATMNFIGLDNYGRLFSDDVFRRAVLNNIELGIVVPLVTIVLALAVASMVTVGGPSRGPVRGIRASSLYRVVSFFPYTIPAIVIGLIWAQVYNPSAGILNGFLGLFGVDQINWLGEPGTAMPASMFVIIWSFVGFYAVLFVAAIKGISAEVYEAARLDGAGRFRTAISVTVPLIRDTIQTAYIYIGIAALDAFVYMMALNPFGGPGYSTLTMSQDLYNTAFRKGQFGYATAMGVVLAVVTLLFATLVFAVNRLTGGGGSAPRARKRRDTKTTAVAAQPVSSIHVG